MITMKVNARLLAALLAVLFILTAFAGCNLPQNVTPGDSYTETTTGEADNTPPKDIAITKENAKEYTFIRSWKASDKLKTVLADNFRTVMEKLKDDKGESLKISDDWVEDEEKIPETANEIVVGETNRPDGKKLFSSLCEKDYIIKYENGRVFILGGSEESTLTALERFFSEFVDKDTGEIRFTDKLDILMKFDYPIASVSIDGVSIREYTVVVPAKCDLYTTYAAENLNAYLRENAGFSLQTVSDAEDATEYEILVGNTNRPESKTTVSIGEGEYVLYKAGKKVVCLGNSYMVGGGVGMICDRLDATKKKLEINITDLPTEAKAEKFTFLKARSAILLIGDGMGFNTLAMAEVKIGHFNGFDLPNQGQSITASVNTLKDPNKPTDSAAGGTALSSGYKTTNGYVGLDRNLKSVKNLRELAQEKGLRTGILTTDVITGATPAAFLAHQKSRKDTAEIQKQIDTLVKDKKVDVTGGSLGNAFVQTTKDALRMLSSGGSGFFLMAEEAYIDKNSHSNKKAECISAVARLSDEIAYCTEFVLCHRDTVLIVTADHETGGIVPDGNGDYKYTITDHSTANVPILALGDGTEYFKDATMQNIFIAKFLAKIYGEDNFGMEWKD